MLALKEENYVVIDCGSWRIKARKGVPREVFEIPSLFFPMVEQREIDIAMTIDKENDPMTITTPDNRELVSDKLDIATPTSVSGTMKATTSISELSILPPPDTTIETSNIQPQSSYSTQKRHVPVSNGVLTSKSPIERGEIKNWEQLEAIWRHIILREFNIKRTRNESPVILTTPSNWTKDHHERIAQIFFEHFNTPGLYIANQGLMALYGCGSINGLVVDIGHGTTHITPIIDTVIQYQGIQILQIAGQDIDQYFLELLQSDEQLLAEYGEPIDLDFARAIKESKGYCRRFEEAEAEGGDDNEDQDREEAEYNGKMFTVGAKRGLVCEPFFYPNIIGKNETFSLPEAIHHAIMSCEADKRLLLWENIVLSGGSTSFKGFKERLQREMETFRTISENVGDCQPKDAKFLKIPDYFLNFKERQELAGFLGASIVAKIVFADPKNFITKVDYNESGPSVVHRKSY